MEVLLLHGNVIKKKSWFWKALRAAFLKWPRLPILALPLAWSWHWSSFLNLLVMASCKHNFIEFKWVLKKSWIQKYTMLHCHKRSWQKHTSVFFCWNFFHHRYNYSEMWRMLAMSLGQPYHSEQQWIFEGRARDLGSAEKL